MMHWGRTIMVAVVSSILTITLYHNFVYKGGSRTESAPNARFAAFTDGLLSGRMQRSFLSAAPTQFTDAANKVTPGVVNIKTKNGDFDFWSDFSGSSGSGVVITPDGYIVTNNHVVEGGGEVEVSLNDHRTYTAKVIGTDPSTDLALLKIKATDLPFLVFGNSDSLQVGEWVLAVGNPFELESTVTAGIVSARGRSIGILDDSYRVESFIQTDAAVNPGNSGGALCNTAGELIGINTAIVTRSGRYEGYSFAIPANLVRKVVRDLREYGMVQRAILGIATSEVDAKRAKELKLPNIEGVFLENVSSKGSADEAGLKKGDVIVSINGSKTRSVPELQELVARQRPGNKIEIEFFREGEKKKTTALLKNKSNSTTLVESVDTRVLETLGFEARELTVSEKRRLKVEGVMVKSVIKGSTIDRTHMDPGFIILEVNGKQVKTIADLVNHLNELRGEIFLEGIYENFEDEWVYKFKK